MHTHVIVALKATVLCPVHWMKGSVRIRVDNAVEDTQFILYKYNREQEITFDYSRCSNSHTGLESFGSVMV